MYPNIFCFDRRCAYLVKLLELETNSETCKLQREFGPGPVPEKYGHWEACQAMVDNNLTKSLYFKSQVVITLIRGRARFTCCAKC